MNIKVGIEKQGTISCRDLYLEDRRTFFLFLSHAFHQTGKFIGI